MAIHKISRSFGTHDGTFHADEVTACALLLLFDCIDLDKIIRTRDLGALSSCDYVCDVGGVYEPSKKLFDHHQADYQGDLSSAGMVLLYLKSQKILSEKEYQFWNDIIVAGVDAHDNGKDPEIRGLCTYSHIISNFTPIKQEEDPVELEAAFFEALGFAKGLLDRMWRRYKYNQSCLQLVAEAMAGNPQYLVFEHNIPWQDAFFELGGEKHPAVFVVMPAGRHWKLRGVPPTSDHRMHVRMPLPREWAGLLEEDLRRVTGISGAIFCHKGRFVSVWETKEDALRALKKVLDTEKSHGHHF